MSKTKIIYIAGYGRSGSTVLDMLLGNQQEIFGGGELWSFFQDITNGVTKCSCDQGLKECPVWNAVIQNILVDFDSSQFQNKSTIIERYNPIYRLGLSKKDTQLYGEVWGEFFKSVGSVTSSEYVVDSSKTTYLTACRLKSMALYTDIPIKIIHLVRDPRAVMWSLCRGDNKLMEENLPSKIRAATTKSLVGWYIANRIASQLTHELEVSSVTIRYEDLVNSTPKTIDHIANSLQLDLNDLSLKLKNSADIESGHGIAGNRTRRNKTFKLKADMEWKTKLPKSSCQLAKLVAPLARSYGYDTLSPIIKPIY